MRKVQFYVAIAATVLMSVSVFALPDERFSYIQNDDVKLGVITNYGAAVGYFSELSPVRNFINYMDAGREIQQSYYGWDDGSSWAGGKWRWNPVQGGSAATVKPQLLEFVNDNNMIYARSHPRNWAGGELLEDCFMEEWISLSNNIAHITFRMCYSGPSNGPVYDQELPATFLDSYFNRLTYCYENPWSYNTLTNFQPAGIPSAGDPPERNHDCKVEYWSAYVKEGWGMGVYTPGTEPFGYYYVNVGSPGNEGGNCSHFSSLGLFAITTNFTYQYDVYLTIGQTNEIRQAFYDVYDGIINPSFEAASYTNWSTTGTAWGTNPVTTNFLPQFFEHNGLEGNYYANSLKGGETATGVLRSDNFILKSDEQLSFLISGYSTHWASDYNYILLCRASDDVELDKVWTPDNNNLQSRILSHFTNLDLKVYLKVVDDCAQSGWAWLAVDNFNKISYDSFFGPNNGFELADFSNWTKTGTAFGSAPVTTNYASQFFENCGLNGKYYANSMVGGEAAVGTLRSPTFVAPKNSSIKFLLGGWAARGYHDPVYNYVSLKLDSDNSEIDRIYAPGGNKLQEKSLDASSANGEKVYIEVVDNCISGAYAWLSVDNFIVVNEYDFPEIDVENKNFSSPVIPLGSGSQTADDWCIKGDAGLTNISSQIAPLSGQTIFINGSELFQTFEGVKLKPGNVYRLTFDSYSIGAEQTIKAGIGYGINSGANSAFVAPIASGNIESVNDGTGKWLGNTFASGALFTNVLNPSANDPAISHTFTFQTPENLEYTRISCDLGVRFWDASGSQIQLDNVIVTNFPIIPEGGIVFLILNYGFVLAIYLRRKNKR